MALFSAPNVLRVVHKSLFFSPCGHLMACSTLSLTAMDGGISIVGTISRLSLFVTRLPSLVCHNGFLASPLMPLSHHNVSFAGMWTKRVHTLQVWIPQRVNSYRFPFL